MTKVEFIYEKGKIVSFTACGHSGYAPEGEDIVCASISAIDDSQVMLINLKEFLCNLTIEYGKYLTVKEEHVNV